MISRVTNQERLVYKHQTEALPQTQAPEKHLCRR